MKKISFAILLILAFCSVAFAAIKDSPDGFRGVKWGDPAEKYPDLELVEETTREDGVIIKDYARKGDVMSIGNAKLEKLIYRFFDNEFASVTMEPQAKDAMALLDALKIRFGKPEQRRFASFKMDIYSWQDENAEIIYSYTDITDGSKWANIRSKPILDKYTRKSNEHKEAEIKKDL